MQKGNVLLIVLLIAAAIGWYLIYSGNINLSQKQTTQTETSTGETANWKTYENGVVTFKYPSTWETGPDNTDYIVFNDGKLEKTLSINQAIFQDTFDNWCKKDSICKTYTDIQKTEVASQRAYKYTFTKECNGCNYPFTTYYIPVENSHTMVSIIKSTYVKPSDTSHAEEVKALQDPIFNQILSTFKFIN